MSVRKMVALLLAAAVAFSVVGGASGCGAKNASEGQSEDAKFEEYTKELFCKEVSANTISLHYTLKAPEEYGIEVSGRHIRSI